MEDNYTMPIVLEDDDGIRPAGESNKCLYCKQLVGTPHLSNCVVLQRRVKVRYMYELEIEVPWFWDQHQIEFHRNDGTWCADNSINELSRLAESEGCLCDIFSCEVLEIPDAAPIRYNKDGIVVK